MYFHQDDIDWFILANRSMRDVFAYPIGDHVNYVFRVLLKIEWDLFHLYFPGYFTVSILMHASVIWLVYILGRETSNRSDLAAYAALIFSININWSETVLWISGQTISITAFFVLLAMLAVHRKRWESIAIFISSWTSALSLGLPGALIFVYGLEKVKGLFSNFKITRVGWSSLGSVFLVVLVYLLRGTDGTHLEMSAKWMIDVLIVWGLMMINSVAGRILVPFDRFETIRIYLVSSLVVYALYLFRDKVFFIWRDRWSRFLILHICFYYLIVALGRSQYGIGIMRADRYAYLGVALFLLLFVRILRNWTVGRWIWILPIILITQSLGLYVKARAYVVRPQQLKVLIEDVSAKGRDVINENDYLPHFVFNDERLRYRDLMGLMGD